MEVGSQKQGNVRSIDNLFSGRTILLVNAKKSLNVRVFELLDIKFRLHVDFVIIVVFRFFLQSNAGANSEVKKALNAALAVSNVK